MHYSRCQVPLAIQPHSSMWPHQHFTVQAGHYKHSCFSFRCKCMVGHIVRGNIRCVSITPDWNYENKLDSWLHMSHSYFKTVYLFFYLFLQNYYFFLSTAFFIFLDSGCFGVCCFWFSISGCSPSFPLSPELSTSEGMALWSWVGSCLGEEYHFPPISLLKHLFLILPAFSLSFFSCFFSFLLLVQLSLLAVNFPFLPFLSYCFIHFPFSRLPKEAEDCKFWLCIKIFISKYFDQNGFGCV